MLELLLLSLGCADDLPFHRASVIEDRNDGVGGPKALARPGDYLLENDRIRVAVLGPRPSMGPGAYGGSILDVDLRRSGGEWTLGHGNDRLGELVPTVNLDAAYAVTEGTVSIVESEGETVIRVEAIAAPYLGLLTPLRALTPASEPQVELVTDYALRAGEPWVRIRTTATVIGGLVESEPVLLEGIHETLSVVELALGGGLAFGDFFHAGGSVDIFAPGIGFHETGAVYEAMEAGKNLFVDPLRLDFLAGTAEGVSYGLASLGGDLLVPLFASSQTVGIGGAVEANESSTRPAGESWTYERILAVGHGDIGSVFDVILEARGTPRGTVQGNVIEEGSGEAMSGIQVLVFARGEERPTSEWRTDISLEDGVPDGSFSGQLPVGQWDLQVHEHGRPGGERIPIDLSEGEVLNLQLAARRSGEARFLVTDDLGNALPAKVTVVPSGAAASRDPVLGDGYIAGDVEWVLFTPDGEAEILLEPGHYTAYASRGIEYELGEVDFEIEVGRPVVVPLQVIHSVDTTGWISADLHVHSQASFDSGVSSVERVITMAAEGVEFLVSADHDYVVDHAPAIEALGLEYWLGSAVGVEASPVEMGHFIGFPLEVDHLADVGGAFHWGGLTPGQVNEELRTMEDPDLGPVVTFVAHPRDGILGYFDQYGLNPYGGTPGVFGEPGVPLVELPLTSQLSNATIFTVANFSMDFDAIEILNSKRLEFPRTPTAPEVATFASDGSTTAYDVLERTVSEQADLVNGTYTLAYGAPGQIDDWFTLLNLGFRFTALGNSDTHSKTTTEAGCPRNFVLVDTDDPSRVTPGEIADAVAQGAVVTSYGPFITFWANGDTPVGGEISTDEPVDFEIQVQSPEWFDVDRVELYRNGTLIHVWLTEGDDSTYDLAGTYTDHRDLSEDAWYVVIAMGDDDMAPVFTPVELPPVQLQDVVTGALSAVLDNTAILGPNVTLPRAGPIPPFAITNPIWVDRGGDGFNAPGVPGWLVEPVGAETR